MLPFLENLIMSDVYQGQGNFAWRISYIPTEETTLGERDKALFWCFGNGMQRDSHFCNHTYIYTHICRHGNLFILQTHHYITILWSVADCVKPDAPYSWNSPLALLRLLWVCSELWFMNLSLYFTKGTQAMSRHRSVSNEA